jgi:hypothetical protein
MHGFGARPWIHGLLREPLVPRPGAVTDPKNAQSLILPKEKSMSFSLLRRSILLPILGIFFMALASPSSAQTANVRIKIVKGGWVIGAQAGSGTMIFRGRTYPLGVGGLSAGLVFGGSATEFVGTARHMVRPSDIAGVYTAVGAGAAVGGGVRALQMRNGNGVELSLRGRQVGLMANLDLSGMSIALR